MSLGLVQKHHLATYNSQDGNEFVVHIPHRPTFNTTKAGIFYHNMRNLLKNKNAQIMENNSRSSIPQVEEEKKKYTDRDVNRDDHARRFQHITSQPIKWILHAVDNKILHNLPIFLEDVGMTEDIYGTSVPHLQGKKSRHKIHHVEPITGNPW